MISRIGVQTICNCKSLQFFCIHNSWTDSDREIKVAVFRQIAVYEARPQATFLSENTALWTLFIVCTWGALCGRAAWADGLAWWSAAESSSLSSRWPIPEHPSPSPADTAASTGSAVPLLPQTNSDTCLQWRTSVGSQRFKPWDTDIYSH